MSSPHVIEPELLARTPRKVRLKNRSLVYGLVGMSLFLVPFLCVGVGSFLYALGASVVSLAGTAVSATVSGKTEDAGGEGSGPTYRVDLDYQVNGKLVSGSSNVSYANYDRLQEGDHVNIKILPIIPTLAPDIVGADDERSSTVSTIWMFTLVWNAIISVFIYFGIVQPLVVRAVLGHGVPVIGTITKMRNATASDGEHRMNFLYYQFEAGRSGTPIAKGSAQVVESKSTGRSVGDDVTVLYLPGRPSWNCIHPSHIFTVDA